MGTNATFQGKAKFGDKKRKPRDPGNSRELPMGGPGVNKSAAGKLETAVYQKSGFPKGKQVTRKKGMYVV